MSLTVYDNKGLQKRSVSAVYDSDQIGTVKAYAGATVPTNWMLCDGRPLSRLAYPDLFAALGGTSSPWGLPDASSFNIPDLRSRMIVGTGPGAGSALPSTPESVARTARNMADAGGKELHTLTAAQAAQKDLGAITSGGQSVDHSHNAIIYLSDRSQNGGGGWANATAAAGPLIYLNQGSGGASVGHTHSTTINGSAAAGPGHENMPPWCAVAWIIKVTGVQVDAGGAIVGADGAPGAAGGQTYSTAFGDGLSTSFVIAHGMNTRNVTVSVYRTASPWDEVLVDVERTDANTITLRTLPTIPAINEYTVVIAAAGTPGSSASQRFPNFRAITTGGNWGTSGSAAKLLFASEQRDTHAWYDPSTSRFQPQVPGTYRISCGIGSQTGVPANSRMVVYLYKNGVNAQVLSLRWLETSSNDERHGGTCQVDMNGTTDYIEIWGACSSATVLTVAVDSYFEGELIEPSGGALNTPLPSVVTVLPTTPVDGQQVDLLVDTAGTYGGPFLWRCVYRSATPGNSKWHVIEGAQMLEREQLATGTALGPVTSTTPVAVANGITLPAITLPFPGDWYITVYAAEMYMNNTATGYAFLAYSVGGTEANRNDSATFYATGTNQWLGWVEATRKKVGLAANTVIQMKAWTSNASNWVYVTNTLAGLPYGLRARPIRLGP